MKVKGFTLLTYEQVFSNQALKIFEKYGRNCSATDFAWLLGIDDAIGPSYLTSDGGRAVKWFTQTDSDRYREVYIIDDDGSKKVWLLILMILVAVQSLCIQQFFHLLRIKLD